MNTLGIDQFRERVAKDPVMSEECSRATDRRSFVKLYVRLGRETGFRFSERDVDQAIDRAKEIQESKEAGAALTAEQLRAVAGLPAKTNSGTSNNVCC